MNIRKWLATLLRTGRGPSKKFIIVCIVVSCMLLSGFSAWNVAFPSIVEFSPEEAVNLEMIKDFDGIVDPADLEVYLGSDIIANEIMTGMMANLSGNVYDNIEMAEMHDEPLGLKIVRIILDRLFS